MIADVFFDSLIDTLKMVPFLLVAYLLIEYIEHRKSDSVQRALAKGGRWGIMPGAVLGLIPQCGFSAMAANFYASRVVTLGTLIAVFISTSDEAIPILLSNPDRYSDLAQLLGVKLVWALLVGFLIDFVFRRFIPASLRGGWGGEVDAVDCHDHEEEDGILLAALKHTLNITLWILAFTFLFGLLVEWLGETNIESFFQQLGFFQPVMASVFGLIPNCASSVLLTKLYMDGVITFGSVAAGLCTNAGIGIVVLFKANKNPKQNLFILALALVSGTLIGVLLHAFGF